jgi:hypothetical protein
MRGRAPSDPRSRAAPQWFFISAVLVLFGVAVALIIW